MRHPIPKPLPKAIVLLMVFLMLPLVSCAKAPEKEYTPEEIVESVDEALHSIKTDIEEIPAEEVDWEEAEGLTAIDNPDETASIVYLDDIKLDRAENAFAIADSRYLNLTLPNANPSEYLPGVEHLRLYDENGTDYELSPVLSVSGFGKVAVPIKDMWRGHLYHLDLLDENLCFYGKSPNVRSLSLVFEEYAPQDASTDEEGETPDEWPAGGLQRKNIVIRNFHPEDIYYYDKDGISLYLISALEFTGLAKDELFRIGEENKDEQNQWIDDEETFYGHFTSCQRNPNGAGYLIRYSKADSSDIYEEVYAAGSEEVDMSKGDVVADHEELEEFVLTSESLRQATYGIFKYYRLAPNEYRVNALDWFSHLKITFSTKYDGKSFVFKVGFKLTINPEKRLNIVLQGDFTSKTTYNISAAAKIQKKWGFLPVGASFNIKVEEDNVKTWTCGVTFDVVANPFDKKEATDKITKAIDEANDETLPWKSIFANDGKGSKTTNKHGAKWALFKLDINYFVPITIRLQLSFYFEANLSFQAVLSYSSHTQRVDMSYSTSDPDGKAVDAANESKEVETGSLSLIFIGKMSLEGGISVTFGFGFFGLYKYLHAEVEIKAGGLLEIVGYLSFTWVWGEHDDGDFSVIVGGKIELSIVLNVKIDVFLISIGYDHTWPLGKWPLLGLANMDSILDWANDYEPYVDAEHPGDDVNIREGSNINDLGLLIFTVFNGSDFAVKTVGHKWNYGVKVFYGALIPDSWEVTVNAFEITLDGDYLSLEEGVFSPTAQAPTTSTFDTIMTIKVADSLGKAKDRKFRLRYHYSVGELVHVTYSFLDGYRGEDSHRLNAEYYFHPGADFTFTLPSYSPLGYLLYSYSVTIKDKDDNTLSSYDVAIGYQTNLKQTINLSNSGGKVHYDIFCNYRPTRIYPVYFLGFMGRTIGCVEANGGASLYVPADTLAEIVAEARITTTDLNYDEFASSEASSSVASGYEFAGWENWPDTTISGPYVVRAYYNKV